MSGRSHRSLRLGALALLAMMAVWPRARGASTTAELASRPRAAAFASGSTHGVAARAETTAAKLVSPPRNAKLVAATGDDAQASN